MRTTAVRALLLEVLRIHLGGLPLLQDVNVLEVTDQDIPLREAFEPILHKAHMSQDVLNVHRILRVHSLRERLEDRRNLTDSCIT
jgi:hypothetical protein